MRVMERANRGSPSTSLAFSKLVGAFFAFLRKKILQVVEPFAWFPTLMAPPAPGVEFRHLSICGLVAGGTRCQALRS